MVQLLLFICLFVCFSCKVEDGVYCFEAGDFFSKWSESSLSCKEGNAGFLNLLGKDLQLLGDNIRLLEHHFHFILQRGQQIKNRVSSFCFLFLRRLNREGTPTKPLNRTVSFHHFD